MKVTIVGYYRVSDDQLEDYELEDFDPAKMAEVDAEEYPKYNDPHLVIDLFLDGNPTSVTFEAVDMGTVDPDC